MDLRIFIVDAFTTSRFCGNPAAVVLLHQKLPDTVLLDVTKEINQTETAFLEPLEEEDCTSVAWHIGRRIRRDDATSSPAKSKHNMDALWRLSDQFRLRWFTPTGEIVLCGHATLAAAHVLFQCLGNESSTIKFNSLSGTLLARRSGSHIVLDFPANHPIPLTAQQEGELGPLVEEVRGGLHVNEVRHSPALKYLMVRLDDSTTRHDLESLRPDSSKLLSLHDGSIVKGIIVTVRGSRTSPEATGNTRTSSSTSSTNITSNSTSNSSSSSTSSTSTIPSSTNIGSSKTSASSSSNSRGFQHYLVASRFFDPWFGFSEDPVTGSAHTVLGPYWSEELNMKSLTCRQCSPRGGDIEVTVQEDGRIALAGHSVMVMHGTIAVDI